VAYWKSEAVCLRVAEFGETSLVVSLLTRERGRVDAVAKGARRPGSRFLGALEPLVRADLLLIDRKTTLPTLAECEVTDIYRGARREARHLHASLYVLELLREALPVGGEPGRGAGLPLYEVTRRALDRLARNPIYNPLTVVLFELHALRALGHEPQLARCAECGDPPAAEGLLAPTLGGAVCARCFPHDRHGIVLGEEAATALRKLLEDPDLASARPSQSLVRPLGIATGALVLARLERRLRLAAHVDRG
jgi:DNA repair protein RecO (recombination protein O)